MPRRSKEDFTTKDTKSTKKGGFMFFVVKRGEGRSLKRAVTSYKWKGGGTEDGRQRSESRGDQGSVDLCRQYVERYSKA